MPKRAAAPEGHPTLSGIVYDSLNDQPVRGATVIIAGTARQTVTDSNGMYRFDVDSLPEGVATVGFFMASMDSMGITPPVRQIGIHHGESALLDLGVPSMRTVLRVICRDSASEGKGLMMGVVRNADTNVPLVGALVVVMWTEMNIGASRSRSCRRRCTRPSVRAATTGSAGFRTASRCARRRAWARRRADGST